MTRIGLTLTVLVASLGAYACTDGLDDNTDPLPPGGTGGDIGNTFDHDNNTISVWDLLERLENEGPQTYTSHMHHCPKPKYETLGNILASLGVNMNATGITAGGLYRDGFNAYGGPNYANRVRENISITTSGSSREFDIFAAAADEIITAMPTIARCQVGGVGPSMFDATTNACRADGITCLIGQPATAAHLDLCNLTIMRASDVATGKRLAVAAMLAAAYTCE